MNIRQYTSDSESEWRWLAIWEKTESKASLWACSESDRSNFRDESNIVCFSFTESRNDSSRLAWLGNVMYTRRKSVNGLTAVLKDDH